VRAAAAAAAFLVVAVLLLPAAAHAEEPPLAPSPSVAYVVPGTKGENIEIYYMAHVSPPPGYASCRVQVYESEVYGLTPVVKESDCINGDVTVVVTFNGSYDGTRGQGYPVWGATVSFYDANGTLVGSDYLEAQPVTFIPVNFTVTARVKNVEKYVAYPANPKPGDLIYFYPSGTLLVQLEASHPPTFPDKLLVILSPEGPGSPQNRTIYIGPGVGQEYVYFDDVNLAEKVTVTVKSGNFTVTSTTVTPSGGNMGYAIVQTVPPTTLISSEGSDVYTVAGGAYVAAVRGGRVTVSLAVGGATKTSSPVSTPQFVELDIQGVKITGETSGYYTVTFSSSDKTAQVVIPFVVKPFMRIYGSVISNIFLASFTAMFGAGVGALIVGLLLHRPDLMKNGALLLSASSLVFFIPMLFGYAVSVLAALGFPDPVGASKMSITNFGDVVAKSILFISSRAHIIAYRLEIIGIALLGVLAVLGAIASAGGIIGEFLTGGALSEFLGKVLGTVGEYVVGIAVISLFGGALLDVLSALFGYIIIIIVLISYVVLVILALYATFTGDLAQLVHPVVNIATLLLVVIMVPPIYEVIWRLGAAGLTHLTINFKVVEINIPNPFYYLGAATMQAILLIMVVYFAYSRLMAALSGGAR